jgi:hypothetical protein
VSSATPPVVEEDAAVAGRRPADLSVVKCRHRIDTIGSTYYTVADGDGQTMPARDVSLDVGGDLI